jgi:p-hydroxybenzoate 3-monooxygenase
MLGHLLHLAGIDSVIIEDRARDYVIERVRAGVLEQGTVDMMVAMGVGERLMRQGLRHDGVYISFLGERHHIDMARLNRGRTITVYGQNEVVKDLIDARVKTSRPLYFEVSDVRVSDLDSATPVTHFVHDGKPVQLVSDFIAGCDGFHGICRPSIPSSALTIYERVYPFAWLGILAEAAPASEELVYTLHEGGFALFSMRSPEITRLYLQVPPSEDIANWTDDAIWEEMLRRMTTRSGWRPNVGRILQKGVTPMRSFVASPMRYGRVFLAGDAAHIVPPTGAKGLNLAAADVRVLAAAIVEHYRNGNDTLLDAYSDTCLRRVWKAQHFSWWMTSTMHRSPDGNPFDYQRQIAELDYLTTSEAAMASFAEQYAGLI